MIAVAVGILAAASVVDPPLFGVPAYNMVTPPEDVLPLDANEDGVVDLVVVGGGNGRVLLGLGQGRFDSPVNFDTPLGESRVLSHDLDGDGHLDLIVSTTRPSGDIGLLHGDGTGHFEIFEVFEPGVRTDRIALADLDGDGRPELIASHPVAWLITVWPGVEGGFGDAQPYPTAPQPAGIVVTDANADGHVVVVVADAWGLTVLAGDGRGSLAPFDTTFLPGNGGDLRVADLNDDGLDDIAMSATDCACFFVHFALPGGGYAAEAYPGPMEQSDLEVADFDGDGQLELVGVDSENGLFYQVVLGRDEITPTYPFGGYNAGSVFAADLNGDQRTDVAVIGGQSVYLAMQFGGPGGLDSYVPYEAQRWQDRVRMVDVDGDGRLDIAFIGVSGGGYIPNGRDGFGPTIRFWDDGDERWPAAMAWGDTTGDGIPDLVLSLGGTGLDFAVLAGDGLGGFEIIQEFDAPRLTGRSHLHLADLDGDDVLDLVTTVSSRRAGVYRGVGDGTFGAPSIVYLVDDVDETELADINLDGTPDLVTVRDQGQLRVLLGDGDGGFDPLEPLSIGLTRDLAVGDVDGDGDLDAIVTRDQGQGIAIVKNDGGTLSSFTLMGGFVTRPHRIFIRDMNVDGIPDIGYISEFGGDVFVVMLGDGEGDFTFEMSYLASDNVEDDQYPIDVGDIDGDGDPDLVVRSGFAMLSVQPNRSIEGCDADFNGDGALDVLDFVAYQQGWLTKDPAADCDANDQFDVLDFVCFQIVFAGGCD